MSLFQNILLDGFTFGMVLFIITVGMSVTMGLMRVINLAHGAFALIGGVTVHWLMQQHGLNYWVSLLLAVAVTTLFAALLERGMFRHIYARSELHQVLATIGLTFMIIAATNFLFGSSLLPIHLPAQIASSVDLGFRTLPIHRLVVIGAGLLVLLGLYLVIEWTDFGIRLRAAVDNSDAAEGQGVNTRLIFAVTFCAGAGLAGLGGVLGAEMLPIDAYYPLRYIVLFKVVVIVGGLGSVTGTFLSAIALGVFETAARYLMPDYATILFYTAVLILLSIRPNGLLGRA